MASLIPVTPPAVPVLTVPQVKAWQRIDGAEEDDIIQSLINAVTEDIDGGDGMLGRCLINQTWLYQLESFPGWWAWGPDGFNSAHEQQREYRDDQRIRLPLAPLVTVDSVKYLDGAEVLQTLDPSAYVVIDQGFLPSILQPVVGTFWPLTVSNQWNRRRPDAVRIQLTCGYGATADDVPRQIRDWMLREVARRYENRDSDIGIDYAEILRFRTRGFT